MIATPPASRAPKPKFPESRIPNPESRGPSPESRVPVPLVTYCASALVW